MVNIHSAHPPVLLEDVTVFFSSCFGVVVGLFVFKESLAVLLQQ